MMINNRRSKINKNEKKVKWVKEGEVMGRSIKERVTLYFVLLFTTTRCVSYADYFENP